jgi:hypothetical protein
MASYPESERERDDAEMLRIVRRSYRDNSARIKEISHRREESNKKGLYETRGVTYYPTKTRRGVVELNKGDSRQFYFTPAEWELFLRRQHLGDDYVSSSRGRRSSGRRSSRGHSSRNRRTHKARNRF